MELKDIKELPMAKTLGYTVTVLTLIGILFSAGQMVYTKIAWAEDVNNAFIELKESIYDKEKRELQDKIFEKTFLIEQGQAQPLDRALKERYELQLQDMNMIQPGVDDGR